MTAAAGFGRRRFLQGGAAALGVPALSALAGCGDDESATRLVFLNWLDYIDPPLLKDFAKEFGVAVNYETYASNDELAKRLAAASATRRRGRKGSSFDLIVPSDNLVRRLRAGDSLRELPESLAGRDNLGAEFRKLSFDPGNRFTVPWATGTTGIGYSKKAFPDGPPDWTAFLDPSVKGKATVLNETRDAVAVGLFILGEDPNSTDKATISKAGAKLQEIVANGVDIDAENYLERITSGDTVLAQGFSSDIAQAKESNSDLEFVIPDAGGLRWVDSLCIPIDAPHPDAAVKFIEFYLRPKISAQNAAAIRINTGNEAAAEFVPDEVLDDPIVYPPSSVAANLSFTNAVDDQVQSYYDDAFGSAKAT